MNKTITAAQSKRLRELIKRGRALNVLLEDVERQACEITGDKPQNNSRVFDVVFSNCFDKHSLRYIENYLGVEVADKAADS